MMSKSKCSLYLSKSYQFHPVAVGGLEVLFHTVDHPATATLIGGVFPHGANAFFEEVVGAIWIQLTCHFDVIKKSETTKG